MPQQLKQPGRIARMQILNTRRERRVRSEIDLVIDSNEQARAESAETACKGRRVELRVQNVCGS